MNNHQQQQVLKEQVEYYLSDQNLEKDRFFNKELVKHSDGYMDIKLILKCNKIHKLNVTLSQLQDSIKESQEVEMNEEMNLIRRKGNKKVPEMKEEVLDMKVKKVKSENNQIGVVYKIQGIGESDKEIIWSQVKEMVNKEFNVELMYITFDKANLSGFIVVEEQFKQSVQSSLNINTLQFNIEQAQAAELKLFWDKHGNHYNGILKKNHQLKQAQANVIIFNDNQYQDAEKLKQLFRNIINCTTNGQEIQGKNHHLLLELLKFHDKFQQKSDKLKHFTVDVHPEFKDTRCFFIVKQDGSQEDFSFVKCVNKLAWKSQQQEL